MLHRCAGSAPTLSPLPHPTFSLQPFLLHPCLNLLKCRSGLTVTISHHGVTVLCVTSAQYSSHKSVQGHRVSQHLGGSRRASAVQGPANTVMFYNRSSTPSCFACACSSDQGSFQLPTAMHSFRVSVMVLGINITIRSRQSVKGSLTFKLLHFFPSSFQKQQVRHMTSSVLRVLKDQIVEKYQAFYQCHVVIQKSMLKKCF